MTDEHTYVAAKVKRGLIHYFAASQIINTSRTWAETWCCEQGWDYAIRDLTPVDGEATCKKCLKELERRNSPMVRVMPKAAVR
jgi:hypothetical protein